MAKNKKKSYLVTPVGSTATSKKQNSKAERIANIAKGVAIAAIPVGRAASTVGKVVSKVTSPKFTATGKVTKTKTVTQGPKAKVTVKSPGTGVASPIKGSKVKVSWDTQGLSVKQQQNVTALTKSQKARRGLSTAKGVVAGVVGSQEPKSNKAKPKNEKKASQKKKK
jgi:hypothetical protein